MLWGVATWLGIVLGSTALTCLATWGLSRRYGTEGSIPQYGRSVVAIALFSAAIPVVVVDLSRGPDGSLMATSAFVLLPFLGAMAGLPAMAVGLGLAGHLTIDDADERRVLYQRIGLVVLVLGGVVGAIAALLVGIGEESRAMVYPVLALVGIPLSAVLLPLYHRRQLPLREPTAEEQTMLQRMQPTSGVAPADVLVYEGGFDESVFRPFSPLFGPFRRVFVPARSFEDYEEETLAAVLLWVNQDGGSAFRACALAVWVAVLSALPLWGFVTTPVVVGTVVAIGATLWIGRRLVYLYDGRVADRVGAGQAIAAIQRQRELAEVTESDSLFATVSRLLLMKPANDTRLARLRQRTGPEN